VGARRNPLPGIGKRTAAAAAPEARRRARVTSGLLSVSSICRLSRVATSHASLHRPKGIVPDGSWEPGMHEQAGGVRAQRSRFIEWCPRAVAGHGHKNYLRPRPQARAARRHGWGSAELLSNVMGGAAAAGSCDACIQVNTSRAPRPLLADRVSRRVAAAPVAGARLVPRPWVCASAPHGSWDCRARRLSAIGTVMAREAVLESTMAWVRVYMFFSTWRQCSFHFGKRMKEDLQNNCQESFTATAPSTLLSSRPRDMVCLVCYLIRHA
jgi:hypothetical protein